MEDLLARRATFKTIKAEHEGRLGHHHRPSHALRGPVAGARARPAQDARRGRRRLRRQSAAPPAAECDACACTAARTRSTWFARCCTTSATCWGPGITRKCRPRSSSPSSRKANHWMVEKHGIFQGYNFFQHINMDRNMREQFRGHPHFERTARFVEPVRQSRVRSADGVPAARVLRAAGPPRVRGAEEQHVHERAFRGSGCPPCAEQGSRRQKHARPPLGASATGVQSGSFPACGEGWDGG